MFWDNFIKVCDMRGLKPTPVLKECQISTGSIGRWQSGSDPNSKAVIDLAKYLHCSTDLLLTGQEYVKPSDPQPLTGEEADLLSMFRSLPENRRSLCFGYVKCAYDIHEEEKRLLG